MKIKAGKKRVPRPRCAESHPTIPVIPDRDYRAGKPGRSNAHLDPANCSILIDLRLTTEASVQWNNNQINALLTNVSDLQPRHVPMLLTQWWGAAKDLTKSVMSPNRECVQHRSARGSPEPTDAYEKGPWQVPFS